MAQTVFNESGRFTVPAGVHIMALRVAGGAGGTGGDDVHPGAVGGLGAVVTGTIRVTPGEELVVTVGKAGGNGVRSHCSGNVGGAGGSGWQAGGKGGETPCTGNANDYSGSGGGGGGASALFRGTTLLLAAGGGGGGGGGNFSADGFVGASATGISTGTGAPGATGLAIPTNDPSLDIYDANGGGGGGGGCTGGAGGAAFPDHQPQTSGSGAGSSCVNALVVNPVYAATVPSGQSGNVTLTTVPPAVSIAKTALNGTGTFSFTFTGLRDGSENLTVNTAGSTVTSSSPHPYSTIGSPVTVTESGIPSGWPPMPSSVSCLDGNGALSGNGSAALGTLAGGTVTLPAALFVDGAAILCSYTNTAVPVLTSSWNPSEIASGGTTVLNLTLNALSGSSASIGFDNTLPSGLIVAAVPAIGGSCANAASAGVVTATPGSTIIQARGLTPQPGSSCTVMVAVTNAPGNTNGSCSGNPAAFTQTAANFSNLTNVAVGSVSSCMTVRPPKPSNSGVRVIRDMQPADGVSADEIEAAVRDSSGNGVGGQTISFTASPDVDLGSGPGKAGTCVTAANGICAVKATSQSGSRKTTTASLAGAALTGNFNYLTNVYSQGTVDYSSTLLPPTAVMTFSPNPIGLYGPSGSTLTIKITNPNMTDVMQGVAFTDNFPSGLDNADNHNEATTCTGGNVDRPNSHGVRLSGGASIPAGGSCEVTVDVKVDIMRTADYVNSINAGGLETGNTPHSAAAISATLSVADFPASLPMPQTVSCSTSAFNFNTGGMSASAAKPVGSVDDHWMVGAGPSGLNVPPTSVTQWKPALVVNPRFNWQQPFSNANWIALRPDNLSVSNNVFYRYDFYLDPAVDAASFKLTLDFYADDWITAAYVNTTRFPPTGNLGGGASNAGPNTVLDAGWKTGLNSLVLQAWDIQETPNGNGFNGFLAQAKLATLCGKPTVTVSTVSNGGVGSFVYSGSNGFANATIVTKVAGTAVAAPIQSLTTLNSATTISQAAPVGGLRLSSISCTNLGTGGTATPTFNSDGSGSVLLDAKAIVNNRNVACTFTNDRAPTLSKDFNPSTFSSGGTTAVVFTLSNPVGAASIPATFVDTLPTSLVVAATPAIGGTCTNATSAGVVTAAAGGTSISVTGVTVPAGSSCTVSVAVTNVGGATNASCTGNPAAFVNGAANITGLTGFIVTIPPTGTCVVIPPASPADSGIRIVTDMQLPNGVAADEIEAFARDSAGKGVGGQTVDFAETAGVDLGGGIGKAYSCVTAVTGLCSVRPTSTALGAKTTAVSIAGSALTGAANVAGTVYTAGPAVYTFALAAPSVTKTFNPAVIAPSGHSTLTITLANPSTTTAITGVAFTDTYPAGLLNVTGASAATTCGAGTVSMPGTNSVSLAAGSIAANASCTVTVDVGSSTIGTYTNTLPAGTVTASNASFNSSLVSAVLTVRAEAVVRLQVITTGRVGANFGFTGTNLASTPGNISTTTVGVTAPLAPAAISVTASRAAVVLTQTAPANFLLSSVSCTDANDVMTGNTGSFGAVQGNTVTLSATSVLPGADIKCVLTYAYQAGLGGRVFTDTGNAGGVANDGISNGGEPSLAGATVSLTDCAATAYGASLTDGGGRYMLPVPTTVAVGAALCVESTVSASRRSTGGSANGIALVPGMATVVAGTAYTYSMGANTDRIAFHWAGSAVGLDFGGVPVSSFVSGGLKNGQPGVNTPYGHIFTAGTAGRVSFSVASSTSAPVISGWTEQIVSDPGCTGSLQAGATQLFPPAVTQPVVAGQTVCVVMLQAVPIGAADGNRNTATLLAAFEFANSTTSLSANYQLDDVTTVSAQALDLQKGVRNVSKGETLFSANNHAKPGEVLEYRIEYVNKGAVPIYNLVIHDHAPAYTSFVSAGVESMPASITSCLKTTANNATPVDCSLADLPGGTSPLSWTFTGTVSPGGIAAVLFRVLVD